MSAISATTAGMRDMSDGTLRISFDIEPRHAQEAYSLFGSRGTAVAIAALNLQATVATAQAEAVSTALKVTGLAYLAVQWCKQPMFWDFMNENLALTTVLSEQDAKALVCLECGIDSRKELNTNAVAAEIFERTFRQPCMVYMQKQANRVG